MILHRTTHSQPAERILRFPFLSRPTILEVVVLPPHRVDRFDVVQATPRPDRIDPTRFVILVPTATPLRPDGVPDPFLHMLVEGIGHVLSGGNRNKVRRALELLDHLHRIVAHGVEWAHGRSVGHRPGRAEEEHEIGELRHRDTKVRFGHGLPLVGEIGPVFADDGKDGTIADVKA